MFPESWDFTPAKSGKLKFMRLLEKASFFFLLKLPYPSEILSVSRAEQVRSFDAETDARPRENVTCVFRIGIDFAFKLYKIFRANSTERVASY